jgi:chemotaxis protein methyltransferase CheR
VAAITIPETYFFRHYPHFIRLRELASERLRRGRPCRVLSAGCSSGEEVWSAVAVLANLAKDRERGGSVVGWDVNARRLIEASEGRYREWSVRTGLHGYESAVTRVGDYFQVSPALRAWARFEVVNLMAPPPSVEGGFDAIFFRNVAIYFDPEVARAVFERLSTLLTDDGLIFVGPSDPVSLPSHAWEHVIADGVRTYRRVAAGTAPTSRRPKAPKPEGARWSLPPRLPARTSPLRVSLGRKLVPRRQKSPRPPAPARTDDGDLLAQVSGLADRGDYARALELLMANKLSSTRSST